MLPDTFYAVTAKYYDANGRDDLSNCYLRLKHPSKPLTMMWYQADGHAAPWAGEEGERYITTVYTIFNQIDDGYQITWSFRLNDQWPEVENAIDFGVYASDDDNLKSGWHYDNTNASFTKEKLVCAIELRKKNTSSSIDTVLVNESLDIYVGASSGDIDEVRFSNDEDQNSVATGRWTDWYEWDTSSGGDWNAETKTMSWTFTTSGEKEVCAEIRDDTGSVKCFANISAQVPIWRRFIQPGDILYDPCAIPVPIIPSFLSETKYIGHIGIYVGNNKTVDPQFDALVHDIESWDYPNRESVQLLRVDCPDNSPNCGEAAAEWALNLVEQIERDPTRTYCYQCPVPSGYSYICGGLPGEPGEGYCTSSFTKNASDKENDWYCSELVWAAYFNQKVNIENDRDEGVIWWNHSWEELEYIDPIRPNEICEDNHDVYPVSGHDRGKLIVLERKQCGCPGTLEIRADCPIDLLVTDPDGLTIDKDSSEIPDAIYWVDDLDGDDSLDVLVTLRRKEGTYQIRVVPRTEDAGPKPQAESTDTYTLVFRDHGTGQEIILAEDNSIEDIPDEPYQVEISDGGDEPITPLGDVVHGPNPVPDTGTAFFYSLPVGTSTAKLMVLSATSGRLLFETPIGVTQTRFPATGTWDPVDNDGVRLANGPYLYVLIANGQLIGQGKMVIQR